MKGKTGRTLSYGLPLFIACFALQMIITLVLVSLFDASGLEAALYLTFLSQIPPVGVALLILRLSGGGGKDLRAAGISLDRAGRESLFAVLAYPLFMVLFLLVIVPLNSLIVGGAKQELVEEIMGHPELLQSVSFVAVVCVAVPVMEEFLFRGILYPGLRFWLPSAGAIILSALVFGILHGASALLPIFAFGCLLGYIRERSRSLLPTILVHMIHNGITLFMIHLGS